MVKPIMTLGGVIGRETKKQVLTVETIPNVGVKIFNDTSEGPDL